MATLAACAGVLAGTATSAGRYALPVLASWPLLVVFATGAVATAWRRPARRRAIMQKVALVAATAAAVSIILDKFEERERLQADSALAAVLAWHDTHADWPDSLEAIGVGPGPYRYSDGRHCTHEMDGCAPRPPMLVFRPNTFSVLEADFANRRWNRKRDE